MFVTPRLVTVLIEDCDIEGVFFTEVIDGGKVALYVRRQRRMTPSEYMGYQILLDATLEKYNAKRLYMSRANAA